MSGWGWGEREGKREAEREGGRKGKEEEGEGGRRKKRERIGILLLTVSGGWSIIGN